MPKPNAWNAFRSAHAGKGYTMAELSAMYAQSGKKVAPAKKAKAAAKKPVNTVELDERTNRELMYEFNAHDTDREAVKGVHDLLNENIFTGTGPIKIVNLDFGFDYDDIAPHAMPPTYVKELQLVAKDGLTVKDFVLAVVRALGPQFAPFGGEYGDQYFMYMTTRKVGPNTYEIEWGE